MKGELDCFSQIIHFNDYKGNQLQSTFWGKNQLSVPRVHTAALIES